MAGRMRIGEMMVRAQLIDELQLNAAMAHQRQWGGKLGSVMVELGFVDEDFLWKGLSRQTGIPRVELPTVQISGPLLARLPVDLLEQHTVFPVSYRDDTKTITVATADPGNMAALDEVGFRTGWKATPALAPEVEIIWAIRFYYRGDKSPCPPLRKKKAAIQETTQQDEDEFKVTDMSGNTVMRKISDIQPPPAAPAFGNPASIAVASVFGNPQSTVAAPLAEAPPEIVALRTELDKGNKFLKSLVEMCIARGIFTQQEYVDRINRR